MNVEVGRDASVDLVEEPAELRGALAGEAAADQVLIQAHSSALSLAFYDREVFPPEYRGDAFVVPSRMWWEIGVA